MRTNTDDAINQTIRARIRVVVILIQWKDSSSVFVDAPKRAESRELTWAIRRCLFKVMTKISNFHRYVAKRTFDSPLAAVMSLMV